MMSLSFIDSIDFPFSPHDWKMIEIYTAFLLFISCDKLTTKTTELASLFALFLLEKRERETKKKEKEIGFSAAHFPW